MNPEQLPEVEQLWLANEAYDSLQTQLYKQQEIDPNTVSQFESNKAAYNAVGQRVVAQLAEVASEYQDTYKTALHVCVRTALYESRREDGETEDTIAWRALSRLSDSLRSSRPVVQQRTSSLEPPERPRPPKPVSVKELQEAAQLDDKTLAARWDQGNRAAGTEIMNRYHELASGIARRRASARNFRVRNVGEAKQEAMLAFLKSTETWNTDSDVPLRAHGAIKAHQAATHWANAENHLVRMPTIGAMLVELAVADNERLNRNEPPMTSAEISQYFSIPVDSRSTDITVKVLQRAYALKHYLDSLSAEDGSRALDRPHTTGIADFMYGARSLTTDAPPEDPAEVATNAVYGEILAKEIQRLPARYQEVITMYYGLCGHIPMSTSEIARLYGSSPQNISLLHLRALTLLKKSSVIAKLHAGMN